LQKVSKKAPTNLEVHPLIANRWSPRALDATAEISSTDLHLILEAGRLAPSAFNEQPWRYFVGKRGDEVFNQILNGLGEFNQMWAKNASALLLVTGTKQRPNGDPHPSYQYDLGLTVSQATFQAHHLGYVTHQMTGFSHDAMCKTFDLTTLEPVVVIAIGKQGDLSILPEQMAAREQAATTRKELSEILIKGSLQSPINLGIPD
jgi:nitroreductase